MFARSIQLYRNSFSGLSREVWLLAGVMLINRSGTMVIPFMTIYLTQQLGFSFGQAGLVMSCFGAGSILGTYLGGRLSDRFGYYPVMFWSLFLGGAMFMLLMWMHSLLQFCVTIFSLSLIADAFRPANMSSVGAYSRPQNLTRSISLIRLAVNLGFSVGPAVGGILAASLGYNWLFVVDGVTCMAAALFFRSYLKPKPKLVVPEEEGPEMKMAVPVKSPYRDKHFLIFVGLMLLTAISFMQLFTTLPVFLKQEYGLSDSIVGLLLAFNGLLISALEMPLIYSIEGRYQRMALIRLGAILIGLSYLVLNLGHWVVLLFVSIIAITFGEMANFPFSNSFAVGRSNDSNRGQYMALYSMSFSMAHVIAPTLGMQLAGHFGFFTLWMVMGGLCGVTVLGYWWLEGKLGKED
ncbi:MAG: MFS transporter [Saprospirales bacterium]|nr:MFS transporter [Saprospirales bacterium]